MAVFRVEKTNGYTVMSNYHLRDNTISLKAAGLLSKMLSLPDDWDYSILGLAKICKEGKDAITTALKELETAGYIQRRKLQDAHGVFSGVEYVVFESPREADNEIQPEISPYPGFPDTGKPDADYPHPENPPQINTKITNYLETNNPPIVPQEGPSRPRRKRVPKTEPEWKPDRFAGFWQMYPRGESKQAAINAWDKLRPDDDLIRIMGRALQAQMASDSWREGVGIPYASTWLNNHRWEDELKRPASTPKADDTKGAYRL